MAPISNIYFRCESLLKIPPILSRNINAYCVKNTTKIIFDFQAVRLITLNGMICDRSQCTPCKQGHFGTDKKNVCFACPPGGFYQDQLGSYTPDHMHYSSNCKRCPIGTYSPSAGAGSIADCQTCPAGTKTDQLANLNSCDCLKNFHRTERYGSCQLCPEGINCTKGFQTLIDGYWWCWDFPANFGSKEEYKNFIEQISGNIVNESNPNDLKNTKYNGILPACHKCPRSKSCNGGSINASCSEGYSGWLCAACSPNYYELFNSCYKCQHTAVIIIEFVVVMVVFSGIGYVVWKLEKQGRGRNRPINHMDSFVTHIKIAINFYQILGILAQVNEIHWPNDFQSVGESLQYLDVIRYINILSPKCIFYNSWDAYMLLYIAIATPFIIMFLTAGAFLTWHVANRCRGDYSVHHLKDKCLSIAVLMLYLTYANTCTNIMAVGPWSIRIFDVTADGKYTKEVLTSDYSIDVGFNNGSVYNTNKNIVYCSLVYVVGFPFSVVIILYYKYIRHRRIEDGRHRIMGLKFFCRQYNSKFWYWEIFEMYNKAILALIANFKDDQSSNLSYSLFVTVILIALHLYLEPMKVKSDQRFQLLTLIFIIVNLSVGAIVDLDETLYTADHTIAVLHDITPFILLLLNLSILFMVFVELLKNIKENIWKELRNHSELTDYPSYIDLDVDNHQEQAILLNAASSGNSSTSRVI
ncbi:putative leucine-rich repeat-containing protein DDB_G0281931 isoform X1 [Anneissia japonica]|uniref:putative leucine-rich repeat-containing protein DDB_G0281931 isoform X1 n=1 Tax=Anneissia japonica TaxID=1529436 RepID=UPI00142580C2|nr:putative leucine-rich repeat-containing protein DDB_G0281931 isoform X1 [Anneissia japonica]